MGNGIFNFSFWNNHKFTRSLNKEYIQGSPPYSSQFPPVVIPCIIVVCHQTRKLTLVQFHQLYMHLCVCVCVCVRSVLRNCVTCVDSYDHHFNQDAELFCCHWDPLHYPFITTIWYLLPLIPNTWQLLICCPSL